MCCVCHAEELFEHVEWLDVWFLKHSTGLESALTIELSILALRMLDGKQDANITSTTGIDPLMPM